MEISNKKRLPTSTTYQSQLSQDLSEQSQSDPDSPIEMTVVINDPNHYWANSTALRCASNAGGGKRDFKFKVIQVRAGPKWFVWKTENEDELLQSPVQNDGCSDQENQHDTSDVRRSMRFMRRKVSNEAKKSVNNFTSFDNELCKITATNQSYIAPMSEPTTRRINSKAISQQDTSLDNRFQFTKTSLSVSPPSTSSGCSSFSMSSSNSDTFQILSVAKKVEYDQDDEDETFEEILDTNQDLLNEYKSTPLILISSVSDNK